MKRIFITASVLFAPLNNAYAGCSYGCRNLTNEKALLNSGLLLLPFAGLGVWGSIDSLKKNKLSSLLFCVLLSVVNFSGLIAMYFIGGYGFLGAIVGTGLLMFLSPKGA
ncbi:hypothetical protein VPX56_19605 [Enterobacter wuhouensis]|uniref:MFS transporter n=1 Tax=Enterobacter wuhouensis TaxID=2529381 RepID=A0ABZ1DGP3_9ENTR|nr:hypothetical protein [Enterobacter wuhouensis]WRW30948.1 hypothetical protein VPX56_19605 [Enterobacter wuhouensis]